MIKYEQVQMPFGTDQNISIGRDVDGTIWVCLWHLCHNIELDYLLETTKLKNNPSPDYKEIFFGKQNKDLGFLCVKANKLNAWFESVSTEKLPKFVRKRLQCYQMHCFNAIYNYLLPQGEQGLQAMLQSLKLPD